MMPLYGRLTHDFAMFEAGAMGQTLMLAAPLSGLGLCGVGQLQDHDRLREIFRLGPEHHLLHTFLGGLLPDPVEAGQARPSKEILESLLEIVEGRSK
jgi:hypothetical protein